MFSSSELSALLEQVRTQLGQNAVFPIQNASSNKTKSCGNNNGKDANVLNIPNITPQKVLVIAGLLGGVLEVRSILVDRDQTIEILLDGSLRRKTKLDKILDEIGKMPFDDVLRAVLGRV